MRPAHRFRTVARLALAMAAPAIAAMAAPSQAQQATPATAAPGERPTIGLVLGGGGARGAAHIGVLEVLERMRVPVDLIVGTSMGAITGGLYAAGLSPEEMEAWLEGADWDELFRDRPSYSELAFRRKREARDFPIPLELGLGRDGLQLPNGLVAGQKLNAALRSMTLPAALVADFDSLAIPFRAVATDLESGEMVVLGHGDLVDALRASMSAPGVFTPYPVADRILVDGGLLRNLPVDVALDMGADIVIAVDVGADLGDRSALRTPAQLTRQVTRIMTLSGATAQWERLRSSDVLILPELDGMGSTEFDRSVEAVAAGEAAALRLESRLRELAVDPVAYAEIRERRDRFGRPVERVDYVVVGPYTGRSPSSLLDRIATRPGAFDTAALALDIAHLYGLGIYERVDYELSPSEAGNVLLLRVREKPWGPSYLRFRMSIRDQFDGQGTYSFASHLLVPQLNGWGAELAGEVELGEVRGTRFELFQPLGVRGLFYMAPSVRFRSTPADMFVGDLAVARFRNTVAAAAFEVGLHIGSDLEVAATYDRGIIRGKRTIGPPELASFRAHLGMAQLSAEYDGLDDPSFPRHGSMVWLEASAERPGLGADASYERYLARAFRAISHGRNTLFAGVMAGTSGSEPLPAYGKLGLGGFLMLSGYRTGEISGDHMLFGRVMLFRSFRDDGLYAGVSLEAGDAWEGPRDLDLADIRYSTAAIVGFRTPLGPIYLGWGTRGRDTGTTYLSVGQSL